MPKHVREVVQCQVHDQRIAQLLTKLEAALEIGEPLLDTVVGADRADLPECVRRDVLGPKLFCLGEPFHRKLETLFLTARDPEAIRQRHADLRLGSRQRRLCNEGERLLGTLDCEIALSQHPVLGRGQAERLRGQLGLSGHKRKLVRSLGRPDPNISDHRLGPHVFEEQPCPGRVILRGQRERSLEIPCGGDRGV